MSLPFHFCPQCGTAKPPIRASRELNCADCGFRFFFNVAAAAGVFIFKGDELLLCVRAKDPGKGMLDIPGGFLEFDESIEEGLRREIHEELGVEIDRLDYFSSAANRYLFEGVEYRTSDAFFTARISESVQVVPQDDVLDVRFYHPDLVDPASFAFESTRQGFLNLLKRLR